MVFLRNKENACRQAIAKARILVFGVLIVLFSKLQTFIEQHYQATDKLRVIELCYKIIFNDLTQNCIIKSKRKAWETLPNDKSLFHSLPFSGLPTGNLTSL